MKGGWPSRERAMENRLEKFPEGSFCRKEMKFIARNRTNVRLNINRLREESILRIVVEAKGLAKSYGPLRALKGISFAIREGECFGFLGHNGAGKSTTMSILDRKSVV